MYYEVIANEIKANFHTRKEAKQWIDDRKKQEGYNPFVTYRIKKVK